ncbi:MAG: hypothetical protein JRH19_09115 [Deltaproteobacteria bacterium]|nr:hypothetical protein [Deltaproteobacteria bacterium]
MGKPKTNEKTKARAGAKKKGKSAAKKSAKRKGARKKARKQAARAPATHPGTDIKTIRGAEVGPGGGEMIFENERVRIWDLALEPGGKSALHTHLLDYVLVQIEGEEVKTQPHPDTEGFYNRRMIMETRPGDTVFIEKGGSETAVNTGKTRWREIAIELK